MADHFVEVREPGVATRRVVVHGSIEFGREVDGEHLEDDQVSRRHLRITEHEGSVFVEDLRSSNGTVVNGARITEPTWLNVGDVITVGRVEIEVFSASVAAPVTSSPVASAPPPPAEPPAAATPPPPAEPPAAATPPPPPPAAAPPPPQPAAPPPEPVVPEPSTAQAAPRPALDELEVLDVEAAVIRFRPGTAGERASAAMGTALRRARKRLAGLGSEPWGVKPQVLLVDPFPDPDRPGEIVTSGTIIDAARGEIWMVVTPEFPPEPPERPLALFFGSALPAGAELDVLLEGYGLFVGEMPDPNAQLEMLELPPLGSAEGEVRSAMARSFVAYLIAREGRESFVRLLTTARAGQVDAAAVQVFGTGLVALEESWSRKLREGQPKVKTGQFLRLTLRYLRPHLGRQIEIFVYMLLGLAFTMVFPFAFKNLLDTAIPSGKLSNVTNLLGLLGVAFVISLLANLRRAYVSAYVSASIVRQVRGEMFERLQALSPGWFARAQQGDVLSRLFSDVGQMEAGVSEALREGIFQMLSIVVASVVMLKLDPVLGVIVLAGAPLVALVYKLMSKGAQRRSIAVQEELGSVFAVAGENYSAQPVVKAFGLERRECDRFAQASDRLFARQLRLQLFGGLFGLSVNMIVTMLRLVILGIGGWLILEGNLTIGALVAFMSIMGEVLSPVTTLTGLGQQIQAATGSLMRINEVLESEPDIADDAAAIPLPPLEREIRLADVGFSYTNERRTLEHVECVIAAGSRVAFVGPTGAGKSSVLQLLQRFYEVDDGAVLFDGHDIRRVTLASLRGQIGVVFQESFMFDTTIRENILMAKPGASDAEIEAAAAAAELHEAIVAMPRGYDTTVGERGSRLSGGQRQRLAIARALLRNPRVLLLDEATSALDPRTERMIADTLDRVSEGRTTISVTHRLTSITKYDRIFVIVAGHLEEQGTHEELVRAGGVYADLWAEQTGGQVAAEAPFDAVAALSQISIFADLSAAELERAAGRLQALDLGPGDTVPEGGGRIAIIRRGRAQVLAQGLSGERTQTAELGPGDAFGVAALLGQESGAVLEAIERVSLLVLDDEAIAALAVNASVSDALTGARASQVVPAGGRRLSRTTFGPVSRLSAAPSVATEAPQDVGRLTGTFHVVRP